MKKYARIQDGIVVEIIQPMADEEGHEIAIEARFHEDFVATLVDVTSVPDLACGWTYDGQLFSAPAGLSLDAVRVVQITGLSAACQASIYAGFTSSALGSAHVYPAKDKDQQNLAASVLDSLMPVVPDGWTTVFWCADADGNWSMRPHTAAQIQQVGRDGKAAILAAIQKNQSLAEQVQAAATVEAIRAITWESP